MPLLKPTQVAAELNVTVERVRYMILTGKLPALNVMPGRKRPTYRVEPAALEAFKRRGQAAPEPDGIDYIG